MAQPVAGSHHWLFLVFRNHAYADTFIARSPPGRLDCTLPHKVELAVCICTRNRPDDLRRCLHSIQNAHCPPQQVIVSDDSDDSCALDSVIAEFPFVTYQRGPRAGLGANRNACLAMQSADFVMFLDDDVLIPPSMFELLDQKLSAYLGASVILSGFEFKHVGDAVVRIEPGNADFWGYQRVPPAKVYKAIVINATLFPAALFRKAKFDPRLRYGSEEMDMAHHALALGYTIRFDPHLFVDHFPSAINRAEYANIVEASRMYAMVKTYLVYESSALKAIAFCLLAPLKLAFGLGRRQGWRGIRSAASASATALTYIVTLLRSRALNGSGQEA